MGKDDRRKPSPTELRDVGGDDASSTEVLHSSRAVPLGEGMPPSPSSAHKVAPERTERLPPSPKKKSAAVTPLAGPGSRVKPIDDEVSDLRPLTAHARLYDAVNDPLRPGTAEHSLVAGHPGIGDDPAGGFAPTSPDPRDRPSRAPAPASAHAPAPAPAPTPAPERARYEPPPEPAPRLVTQSAPTPPSDERRAYPPAPGRVDSIYDPSPVYAPPAPSSYEPEPSFADDKSLPPVRVVRQRRRPKDVRSGRARTGVILVLVLFGMLALVGNAARRMLLEDPEEVATDVDARDPTGSRSPYSEDMSPEGTRTNDEDEDARDEDAPPPSPYSEDVGPEKDDGDEENDGDEDDDGEPAKASEEQRKPKARRGASKSPLKRIALLGVSDATGKAGGTTKVARSELLAALTQAGVKTVPRKQATRGAHVVIERVKRRRSADALVVEVRCKATVRALPGDELEMSTVASASASITGSTDDEDERELVETALGACAQKLGSDVAGYATR